MVAEDTIGDSSAPRASQMLLDWVWRTLTVHSMQPSAMQRQLHTAMLAAIAEQPLVFEPLTDSRLEELRGEFIVVQPLRGLASPTAEAMECEPG